ncbi:MAG: histidinol dehydrogenase, partial [Syntrophomonadaceae bacterium]|nr:histidinol dehydrogenase [Syntrophomonadaceae bacterium]
MKIKRINGSAEELKGCLQRHEDDLALYQERVQAIAQMVKQRGDEAVFELTRKFDGADINAANFRVSEAEIEEAYERVEDDYVFALRHAIDNIDYFHRRQIKNSWMEPDARGNIFGQIFRPLERVGIYVPGGTAAYPSSVLMNAIPAQVAGVGAIAMVTPPGADGRLNPYTLVAAAELDIDEIYKAGGAQAIFALAWGGAGRAPVDLISGPGNIYVTLAKKMVYGDVNIDMLAGPSEILIIADKTADPGWIAADMMSQAEHDVLARSILICDHPGLPDRVEAELKKQMAGLSRKDIIAQALENYGAFVIADNMLEACD